MADARFEPKMLFDGKLVDGEAGTFTNINPATEEVLGEVADASKADMQRAIEAARHAFELRAGSPLLPRVCAGPARGAGGVRGGPQAVD